LIRVDGSVVVTAEFNQVLNEQFKVLVAKTFEVTEVFYNKGKVNQLVYPTREQ
jgi:hypothetical protein